MDTSAISYRVADFLKQHPPFHAVDEADLLALAGHGRVRFFEANEFILWQGEPHKLHVFVIQQGTVSLWDETGGHAELRDVRGAGDLLGAERFNGAPACLYSARSATDVVLYGFPATDFESLVLKYPYAQEYVAALETVSAAFERPDGRSDPSRIFLQDVARAPETCRTDDTLAHAAALLTQGEAGALPIVDAESRPVGLVTANALLAWIAGGGGDARRPVSDLPNGAPPAVGTGATIADAVIAMGGAGADAVVTTTDGTANGRVVAIATARELVPVFGDQPSVILRDISRAASIASLRSLNRRARACVLQHLTSAAATDWITRFTELVDRGILARILALTGQSAATGCWCLFGASGRGEAITARIPHVVLIHPEAAARRDPLESYARVTDALAGCDYLVDYETRFDRSFYVASADEWSRRYGAWMHDPVLAQMALSRPLFDLRPFHGPPALWNRLRDGVAAAVDRDILAVLAHDCLASLPPLTFFEDAVVDDVGQQSRIFRLEHSALQPLVDVGRVFGMAGRQVMGTSTLDRFAVARRLAPAHEAIFREASETLRIVLWQQGRIGIGQGTTGSELPPSLLSRHDRHLLRSGFPAIHRLLEFTAGLAWLDGL